MEREIIEASFNGFRQLVGDEAFSRVSSASVCIVGLGGVGSWVVEALASAKPVVTTDVCRLDGAAEADALVSAPDTDAGFADALVALLRDGRRAEGLAERGREWVRREFDWSRLVEHTEAVYRRVSHA